MVPEANRNGRDGIIRRELETLLSSQTFANAERQRKFLRYLVEAGLEGRAESLKEYTIGIDVFERPPDYDPRIDSTVRVQAGKLRDRLKTYYLTEGAARAPESPIRIDLPKGGYAPVFADARQERESGTPVAGKRPIWLPWIACGLGLLLAVGGFLLGRQFAPSSSPSYRQLTFRRGSVHTARFGESPATILYSAAWAGGPVRAYTTGLGNPESRPVASPGTMLLAVSKGGIAAMLDGAVYAGPPFVGTLVLRPLSGQSSSEIVKDASDADFSPDGSELAIARRDGATWILEYPKGKRLYQTGPTGWISNIRVSPDGARVAFADHRANRGDDEGWVAVVDRNANKIDLGPHWTSVTGLAWSPSGREIWLTGSENGLNTELHAVTLSGQQRLILHMPGRYVLHDTLRDGKALLSRQAACTYVEAGLRGESARDLSWLDGTFARDLSADGTQMLFDEEGEAARSASGIFLRDTDGGGAPRRLSDGHAIVLSPDGRWILGRLRMTSPPRLILVPTEPGQIRTISSPGVEFNEVGQWFADSQGIFLRGSKPGKPAQTFEYDLRTQAVRPSALGGVPPRLISPDGRYYLVQKAGVLQIVSSAGGPTLRQGAFEPGDRPIRWSPDGRFCYVFRTAGAAREIFRIEIATARRESWLKPTPLDPIGLLTIYGTLLSADGSRFAQTYFRSLSDLFLVEGLR